MTARPPPETPKPAPDSRDARLKAALKANLARRKAQARERAASEADDSVQDEG
jgi:hypothetical protein